MDEKQFKHLTNLLRHSIAVEFKIPSQFFSEKYREWKQSKEVQNAWINLQKDYNLQLYKITDEIGIITVRIRVKQQGEGYLWESQ